MKYIYIYHRNAILYHQCLFRFFFFSLQFSFTKKENITLYGVFTLKTSIKMNIQREKKTNWSICNKCTMKTINKDIAVIVVVVTIWIMLRKKQCECISFPHYCFLIHLCRSLCAHIFSLRLSVHSLLTTFHNNNNTKCIYSKARRKKMNKKSNNEKKKYNTILECTLQPTATWVHSFPCITQSQS